MRSACRHCCLVRPRNTAKEALETYVPPQWNASNGNISFREQTLWILYCTEALFHNSSPLYLAKSLDKSR